MGIGSTGRGSINPSPLRSISLSKHRERSSLSARSTADGRRRRNKELNRKELGERDEIEFRLRLRARRIYGPKAWLRTALMGLEVGEQVGLEVADVNELPGLDSVEVDLLYVKGFRRGVKSVHGEGSKAGA